MNNTPNYCWIITTDKVDGGTQYSNEGLMGPSTLSPEQVELLKKGKGKAFTLKDDDGETSYRGRVIDMDDVGMPYDVWLSEPEAGPLNDFGMPNAGCTQVWMGGELIIG